MHKKTKPVKIWATLVVKVAIMKEKTLLSHEVVCFQMLDLGTSNSKSEVSKSSSRKNTSFSKTTSCREIQCLPYAGFFKKIVET